MLTPLGIWSALGPLIGVSLGAYIANRNQRRQWLSACKKEEYKELISSLTKAMFLYISHWGMLLGPEEQRAEVDVLYRVGEIARDRIFIAPTIKQLKVVERWHDATRLLDRGRHVEEFAVVIGKLLDEIRDAALRDIGA